MNVLLLFIVCSLSNSLRPPIEVLSEALDVFKSRQITSQPVVDTTRPITLVALFNDTNSSISIEEDSSNSRNYLARAYFNPSRQSSGWDFLKIESKPTASLFLQHYASGFLEGFLTHKGISDMHHNLKRDFTSPSNYLKYRSFLAETVENQNILFEVSSFKKLTESEFTQKVGLTSALARFYGILEGFNKASPKQNFEPADLYLLNTHGNMEDYKKLLGIPTTIKNQHCSAIVKLVEKEGKYDILTGHETWQHVFEALRTAKTVDFENEGENVVLGLKPNKLTYSSYPGVLFSIDDFYINSYKVVAIQTSIIVHDKTRYASIDKSKLIPEFMRIWYVNSVAESAKHWISLYKSFPSQLYSVEWIVIDYNKLIALNQGEKVESDLIFILDETTGDYFHTDMTAKLKKNSFVGSFNVPFLDATVKASYGDSDWKSHSHSDKMFNSRYFLAEELVGKVHTLGDLSEVVEYNSYKQPNTLKFDLSVKDPSKGLASRADLKTKPGLDIGTDYKLTNLHHVTKLEAIFKFGATTSNNPNLPPLKLSKIKGIRGFTRGIPPVQQFKPVKYGPNLD